MRRAAVRPRLAVVVAAAAAGILLVASPVAASAVDTAGHAIPLTMVVDPDDPADETPTPVPTPTDTVTPTPTPTLEPTPEPTPTDEPTTEPTASPEPTATDSPTPTPRPTETPVPAVPPTVATSTISTETLLIAGIVVVVGAVLLWVLWRRAAASGPPDPALAPAPTEPAPVVLDAMASLGRAMIDGGYPVGMVTSTLEDMAQANGLTTAQTVVFPTSIVVSAGDGESVQTRAVAAGTGATLLYQVDAVDRIAAVARTRPHNAALVRRELEVARAEPIPFSRLARIGAYALLSAALSVLLGSSWWGVALAAVLGLGVGALLLSTERLADAYQALVVVGTALGVSLATLIFARLVDPAALPALVAPLIMLLPGGMLTTAVIELATGHIMSGTARAAAGAMRLLLLAFGVVGAAALVGMPAVGDTDNPLGPFAPWVAVAVFGVAMGVYRCARPPSIGWITLVLYVAYGAQVIGALFVGGALSALVGAAAMTPVAVVVAAQRNGPPAMVSFLPAFWLLVPGALGLVGVATVFEGGASGADLIVTTLATMVSIALGVLVGLAATGSLRGFRNRRAESDSPETGHVPAE